MEENSNPIKRVYSASGVVYKSDSKNPNETYSKDYVYVFDCKMIKTTYGSVIIERPTSNNTLELYPNGIRHILY